jgi:hypothetical protein
MNQEITLIAQQRELEKLYNKNQLMSRIKSEFINCETFDFAEYFEAKGIPEGFALDLLAQMALHKRCDFSTLCGVLKRHYADVQQVADMITKCAEADLVDWNPQLQIFVVCFTITDEVQEELDRFQYPLPFVVPPKKVKTNQDTGMFTSGGSIILKKNHHDEDVCLDHINRCNAMKFTIDQRVVDLVKNQWRNLDKPKENETKEDFMRRKKAFEKYDRTAKDVMKIVQEHSDTFHLGHKYDKRGRSYCQGYHVNYQGTAWNKAVILFANQEVVE